MSMKECSLKEILEMSGAIDALANTQIKLDIQASIALARNQQKLKPFVDGFKSATKLPDGFESYRKEMLAFFNTHAEKTASGDLAISNGAPVFKSPDAANAALTDINQRYSRVIMEKTDIDRKIQESLSSMHMLDLDEVSGSSFSGSSEKALAIAMALMPITVK